MILYMYGLYVKGFPHLVNQHIHYLTYIWGRDVDKLVYVLLLVDFSYTIWRYQL